MKQTKKELIIKYISDSLQPEEKITFYNLIISDAEFKKEVIQEIKIKKRVQSLQTELKPETKEEIYNNIVSISEKDFLESFSWIFIKWVYQLTVPEMVSSALK